MVVPSGPGRIRWGTTDLDDSPDEHTYGSDSEDGALFTDVEAGDLLIIPAGVAHMSYNRDSPSPEAQYLTGGDAYGIEGEDAAAFVGKLKVSGFTMMGAYPRGKTWGWSEGGADAAGFEAVWRVKNADLDPVLGAQRGIHTNRNIRSSALRGR
ncbi:hypothetical protein P168DRAFT_305954 [Aspergillus campestris IBT 28561]|uniref:Cupin type-1 domain-containing protein n=1 Tax=Aspergillus campestris (strain IBT 28561) TaxID=1392248 RepID=A0A2I1CYJ1_ASPC2|nr:uncharacterized protein P168DRAFT_305954 [Aspergillus campestris IBT 28561]PKY02693.1 hypothetical protein P168DRAFT_305954 [Aspergillus campestris IBT 28561]